MPHHHTDRSIKALEPPESGYLIEYDTAIKGFGVRVTASGVRSFMLTYRRRSDGHQRRWTIGSLPEWGTHAAREEAKRLKRIVDGGGDPVGSHKSDRLAPTVGDLCDRFEEEFLPRKRRWTQLGYRQQLNTDIRPALSRMKVAAVTFADIDRLHRDISKRAPTHANRVLAVLSKMFNLAIRWGWLSDNPCKGIERNPENKRRRYLSGDELVRLTTVLAEHRDQQAANIVRLLLFTGARRGEALAAEWEQFDLEKGVWSKPGATTKQRTDHIVPLSAPARELVATLHETRDHSTSYVFPTSDGGHRLDVDYAWRRICKDGKLKNLHLHDLRHTFAATLASTGFNLHIIGGLLGHTQPSTTARYAHLQDDPLRVAVERAGAILSVQPSAAILPLKKGGR
jgi:integrase